VSNGRVIVDGDNRVASLYRSDGDDLVRVTTVPLASRVVSGMTQLVVPEEWKGYRTLIVWNRLDYVGRMTHDETL